MNEELNNQVIQEQPRRRGKKRLLLLILLLLITGVMLSTSTYAWFTANETVSVSNIRVNVAATNGIQISADGQNWKSILQTTDLTSARTGGVYGTAVNMIPSSLEPVSTVGNITNGKLDMFYGEVVTSDGSFVLTAAPAGEKDNNDTANVANSDKFIAFDIFLKVNGSTPTFLSSSSGITTDDVTDSGIKNASRVAFLNLGNATDGTAVTDIQRLGSTMTTSTETPVHPNIWEPNFDTHTESGIDNARDTYHLTELTTPKLPSITAASNTTALPYEGIKATIPASLKVALGNANSTYDIDADHQNVYANYFASPATMWWTSTAAWSGTNPATYHAFETLSRGVTKFRIYVWVEGQDVDCENNASGGNIIFNLQLTTNDGSAQGA